MYSKAFELFLDHYCKLTAEFASGSILKIGQCLMNL